MGASANAGAVTSLLALALAVSQVVQHLLKPGFAVLLHQLLVQQGGAIAQRLLTKQPQNADITGIPVD